VADTLCRTSRFVGSAREHAIVGSPAVKICNETKQNIVSPIGPTVLFFDSGLAKGRAKRGASFTIAMKP